MNETIISFDPDSNGAVAIIGPERSMQIASLQFVAPGEVDLAALRKLLACYREMAPPFACVYIERQRLVFVTVPNQQRAAVAVKSSVTLVKIEYAIRGLLAGMNIPMESIPPGSWKKCFVHGKEAMLPVASRMFPSVVWSGNAKKKEGQATALMLAEWGRREREGRPK